MQQSIPGIKLNNGIIMPQIGFGVFQVEEGEQVESAVTNAFQVGYRAIDTAKVYNNEEGVGRAIKASGIPREELFITTKLWNDDQGYDSTLLAFQESLKRLGLDYVDLYLIHWPKPSENKIKETWRGMEEIYNQGKSRVIGVCNYHANHLDQLLEDAKVVPAVNQIELHPFLNQVKLRAYCAENGIAVESWSPIMRGGELLNNEVFKTIGDAHGKQPAQVILRWHIQHGLIVIPRSVTPERIKANIEIFDFELTPDEMQQLDSMDQGLRVGPNPDKF